MTISKARYEANQRYLAKNYERLSINVRKGKKTIIQQRAEALGLSVNAYVLSLIERDLQEAEDNS